MQKLTQPIEGRPTDAPEGVTAGVSAKRIKAARAGVLQGVHIADAGPWTVRTLGFEAPGRTAFFSYDEGPLPDGRFRVRTRYTGLSAGTELTHFKGSNQYLHKTWDETLKLFRGGAPSQQYPLWFSGYMEVGEVCASRCEAVREGDVVAMAYGHKTGHTADPQRDLFVPLPGDLDPVLGIYVAQMGPICANAILHADEDEYGAASERFGSSLAGHSVMVFGSGVVGLLVAMMTRWCGAAEVAVVDTGESRLGAAQRLGFQTVDTATTEPAVWAKARWGTGPTGEHGGTRGADVVFQCRAQDGALAQALDCLRPQGAVIDLAFYQGGAPSLNLGEAFHHSGLRHIAAQIFRVPRKLQHSWNRRRLSEITLHFLRECGDEVRRHLITDVIPIAQAQQVYEDIASKRAQPLQVVFCVNERDTSAPAGAGEQEPQQAPRVLKDSVALGAAE